MWAFVNAIRYTLHDRIKYQSENLPSIHIKPVLRCFYTSSNSATDFGDLIVQSTTVYEHTSSAQRASNF